MLSNRSNRDTCSSNSECVSQKCQNQVCVFQLNPPKKTFDFCPLHYSNVASINGDLTNEVCPCIQPDRPTAEDAANAVDEDLSTVYVSNWAIGSGLEFAPKEVAPIKSLRVCISADDCPECDPICYKIDGKCAETRIYTVVQEGKLD